MILNDLLGVRILLWMGTPVAFPQPPEVIESLTTAEVTQGDDGDGFQLTFVLTKDLLGFFPMLLNPATDVFSRVTIGVVMGAVPTILINGVITHQQVEAHNEPGRTALTLTGRDVSVMMDLEEKNESYPNQPDFFIVGSILARYPELAILPVVTPTTDLPIQLQRIPRQAETDLQFIKRMAARNGFVFHVNAIAPNVNQGAFGPELRVALPQSAFTVGSISDDNVTSLHFSNDGLAPPSLRQPPLTLRPTPTKRKEQLRESANETVSRALLSSVSKVTGAAEPVTGTGEVDITRYGSVLRARGLVGVRGVGPYDGFYYLRQVTHHFEIGKYSQSFVMTREGVESPLPVVVP